jgi:tetratricopeptide (TPR) repeat protein
MVGHESTEAIRLGREALAMAEELGLDAIRAHALDNIGVARCQTDDLGGIEDLERSIEIAEAINSPESVRAYTNLATVFGRRGDLRRSWELKAEGRRLADRFGSPHDVRWMEGERVSELYSRGCWDDALKLADKFIAECEAGSPHYLEHSVRAFRGRIRLARGDTASALDDAAKGLELAEEAKDPQALVPALAFSVLSYLSSGQNDKAGPLLDRAMAAGGVFRVEESTLELVWLLAALGRAADLDTTLTDDDSFWAEAARAIVSGDFGRAADLCAEIGVAPDEAYARLRAAEALAAAGRRAEADSQLERALEFYRSVRATRHIREGEALLAASA